MPSRPNSGTGLGRRGGHPHLPISKEQPREHRTLPIVHPVRRRGAGRDRGAGPGRLRILLVVVALGGPVRHGAHVDLIEPNSNDGWLDDRIG